MVHDMYTKENKFISMCGLNNDYTYEDVKFKYRCFGPADAKL